MSTHVLPEVRVMIQAAKQYLRGEDLHAGPKLFYAALMCERTAKALKSHRAIIELAERWKALGDAAWNEWGHVVTLTPEEIKAELLRDLGQN